MKTRLPVRKAILERRTYEVPAEGRLGKIRLDFNENTSGCGKAARQALARLSAKELAMYPEYDGPTRRFASYFRVRPDELALTNGGDDALRVFFDTFVEPNSHILICEPTFPMYRYYAEIAGASVKALRYTASMAFPLEDVLAALQKKPRILFLANPNNPTGTLVSKNAIARILRATTETVIVVDEAYSEFSGESAVPWTRRYPHLFVAKTFSKAAGLAGLRLGAVIAQRDSLAMVKRALPPYPVNVGALAAGVAAIEDIRHSRRLRARSKALAHLVHQRIRKEKRSCISQRWKFRPGRFWRERPRSFSQVGAARHPGARKKQGYRARFRAYHHW